MINIRWLVAKALETGWLSLEIEYQIKEMLSFDREVSASDLELLSELQEAVADGKVKREQLEVYRQLQNRFNTFRAA